jgi:hypothetical protein
MNHLAVRISPEINLAALKKFGQWWEQRQKTEKSQLSTDAKKSPKTAG